MFFHLSSPFFGLIDFFYVLGSHTWLNGLIYTGSGQFYMGFIEVLQSKIGF